MGLGNKTTEPLPTMTEDTTGSIFDNALNNSNENLTNNAIYLEHEHLLNISKKMRQEIVNNESKIEDYQDLSADMLGNPWEKEEMDLFKRNEQLKKGLSLVDQQQLNLENIEFLNNEIKDGISGMSEYVTSIDEAKIMLDEFLIDKAKISKELKKLGFE